MWIWESLFGSGSVSLRSVPDPVKPFEEDPLYCHEGPGVSCLIVETTYPPPPRLNIHVDTLCIKMNRLDKMNDVETYLMLKRASWFV